MPMLLNNRYKVLEILAEGGFGLTFLADDVHMPSRRRCVVKQLKPIANPEQYELVKERFEREATILEKLGESCDQVPKLYAYFIEDNKFYLVQEWVKGLTLTQWRQRLLNDVEINVRKIIVDLLVILSHIHEQKIIHRDIKPDNVIIRERDSKLMLIDFGIVKEVMRVDAFGNPTSSIIAGTSGYMSLEQAAGKPVFASDIYSIGMTAIYLLTGKNPQKMADLLSGEVNWYQYAPFVSRQFAAILDKATEALVRDRYQSADEMLITLQDVIRVVPQRKPKNPATTKLYVDNLSFQTVVDDLLELFSQAGTVQLATIIEDRETGRSLGYGFVAMSTSEEAAKAIEMFNGKEFLGRNITVKEAKDKRRVRIPLRFRQ